MHLHLHLEQCIENFGPAHSFSFERYNGILGSYHINMKSIEVQFMKQFSTGVPDLQDMPKYFNAGVFFTMKRWTLCNNQIPNDAHQAEYARETSW